MGNPRRFLPDMLQLFLCWELLTTSFFHKLLLGVDIKTHTKKNKTLAKNVINHTSLEWCLNKSSS